MTRSALAVVRAERGLRIMRGRGSAASDSAGGRERCWFVTAAGLAAACQYSELRLVLAHLSVRALRGGPEAAPREDGAGAAAAFLLAAISLHGGQLGLSGRSFHAMPGSDFNTILSGSDIVIR